MGGTQTCYVADTVRRRSQPQVIYEQMSCGHQLGPCSFL